MEEIKIGNWLITREGIKWNGKNKIERIIGTEELLLFRTVNNRQMYNWLIHFAKKSSSFITEEDIYSLNTSFIIAINKFGLDLNMETFVETVIEQQRIRDNNEEIDEITI